MLFRSLSAIASLGMASGIGGFIAFPYTHLLMDLAGWKLSLLLLAATTAAVMPLAWSLAGKPGAVAGTTDTQSLGGAIKEAFTHPSYLLLVTGFFVCGFQLAFIGTHLPGYLTTCSLPAALGATAFAVIGFFNMIGTWACGGLGARFRLKYLLALLYTVRGLAILLFLLAPKGEASVLVFAAVMGLTWLGTVPLTSGLVAQIFGPRYLGTLFGLCFLNHQIGSFFGAWLGGYLFDTQGSYDPIWILTGIAGFVAGILHMPINDRAIDAASVEANPIETMKAEVTS